MPATREQIKRVIKHRPSGSYYMGDWTWTKNAADAKIFPDLSVALETARNDGLNDCCIIVLRIGSQEIDAQFPIF